MEKFTRLFLLLIIVLIGMYLFLPGKPYVYNSKVHGKGLFTGKNYKQNEVIFENIFPHKENSVMLFNPIEKSKLHTYILNECKYMNHCSLNNNTIIISEDYKIFKLVAKRDIQKNEELYNDYNATNKHFPFMTSALPTYVNC